jgi:hypothetical protein
MREIGREGLAGGEVRTSRTTTIPRMHHNGNTDADNAMAELCPW